MHRQLTGTRIPRICAALIAFVMAYSAIDADAKGRPRILILRTEGTAVADKARVRLTKQLLRATRRYKRYTSIESRQDLVEEMFAFECTEPGVECLAKIGKKYRAQRVVYSEVARNRAGKLEWLMRVVIVDAKNITASRVAQSTKQSIPNLTDTKEQARKGLVVMIGPIDLPTQQSVKPGTLIIRLVGGGVALVYANKQMLGRTSVSGLRKKLAPGRYKLRVVRAGFEEWSLTVNVKAGAITSEMVELLPMAPSKKALKPGVAAVPTTSKWWFWPAVVGGAAAVGVVIWAVTRGDDGPGNGVVGFSIDSADAHKDPVFVAP